MFFTIKNNNKLFDLDTIKAQIKRLATKYIYSVEFTSNDYALDNYLKNTYGYGLRTTCVAIINMCDIMTNGSNDFRIFIKDSNLDSLATFITYGNGYLNGSVILREAFNLD